MTKIYFLAAHVLVYTGPEEETSWQGIALLNKLHQLLLNKVPSSLGSLVYGFSYYQGLAALPNADDSSWKAVRQLLRRPWPQRVWIVQEVVVNSSVILLCGCQILMPWMDLLRVMTACKAGELALTFIVDYNDTSELHDTLIFGCLAGLLSLRKKLERV